MKGRVKKNDLTLAYIARETPLRYRNHTYTHTLGPLDRALLGALDRVLLGLLLGPLDRALLLGLLDRALLGPLDIALLRVILRVVLEALNGALLAILGKHYGGIATATAWLWRPKKSYIKFFGNWTIYGFIFRRIYSWPTAIYHEFGFCVHLAVVTAKIWWGGCQTAAPANGFAKRSTLPWSATND